jgi:chorismate dehydratase
MRKIRVSAVKYTNSIPFIYGLQNYPLSNEISLSLDTPAECFSNVVNGNAEIGLVPVVIKKVIPDLRQITDFGIAADGEVLSVELVSKVPLEKIDTIVMDYQSRTSVLLARVLCREFWHIEPKFVQAGPGFEDEAFMGGEARVVIGDRAFHFHHREGLVVTDLADQWKKMTGLPFVFAIWGTRTGLTETFAEHFGKALEYGISHKVRLAREMASLPEYSAIDLPRYLNQNILHEITPAMHKGMELFLSLCDSVM